MTKIDLDSPPAKTMRERAESNRWKMWLFFTGHRLAVTGAILLQGLIVLLLLGRFGPSSTSTLLTTELVGALFGSVVIAVVTTVTLVLTISQLILSEEISPLGEERDRMRSETDFRTDVEDTIEASVSPAEPADFLRELVEAVADDVATLETAVRESPSDAGGEDVRKFAEYVEDHSEQIEEGLRDVEFGSFRVMQPVLDYNYAWKIVAARDLRESYADEHPDEVDRAFEDVIETLRFFGPAREYFKAMYFQWEIVDVSRVLLYSSMPPLAIAAYMMVLFDPGQIPGDVAGLSLSFVFVSVMYVISLTPFATLLAYLLRLLTVVKRTLTVGPFILRERERKEERDRAK